MISLALIGKDIQHSKSQKMYEDLLSKKINYELIDCPSEKEIPSLEELFSKFEGVSITSPYKTFFLDRLIIEDSVREISAVNCISKINNEYHGFNTDLIALNDILEVYIHKFRNIGAYILGDGVMSRLLLYLFKLKNMPCHLFSRKRGDNFENLSLLNKIDCEEKTFVINCCSREFIFKGQINNKFIFWDLNYSFIAHQKFLPTIVDSYIDGLELLNLQAKHSLGIWDISIKK
jgi:shikimate dehydrogenase